MSRFLKEWWQGFMTRWLWLLLTMSALWGLMWAFQVPNNVPAWRQILGTTLFIIGSNCYQRWKMLLNESIKGRPRQTLWQRFQLWRLKRQAKRVLRRIGTLKSENPVHQWHKTGVMDLEKEFDALMDRIERLGVNPPRFRYRDFPGFPY